MEEEKNKIIENKEEKVGIEQSIDEEKKIENSLQIKSQG